MTLHPLIAEVLASLPPLPDGPLDPVAMRAGEESTVPPPEHRLPLHRVEDVTAQTPTGDVPVRIYTPVEADSFGVLVYFHGGAFFLGSLDTHDHVARSLAEETGLKIVSVGYRRAPEAAFPAGLEDCYGAVRWVAGERAAERLNRSTRVLLLQRELAERGLGLHIERIDRHQSSIRVL